MPNLITEGGGGLGTDKKWLRNIVNRHFGNLTSEASLITVIMSLKSCVDLLLVPEQIWAVTVGNLRHCYLRHCRVLICERPPQWARIGGQEEIDQTRTIFWTVCLISYSNWAKNTFKIIFKDAKCIDYEKFSKLPLCVTKNIFFN